MDFRLTSRVLAGLATLALCHCAPSTLNLTPQDAGDPDAGTSLPPHPEVDAGTGLRTDFPADPLLDTGTPSNVVVLFSSADAGAAGAGPCVSEPESGSLFPNNWLRPRFVFVPAQGENLFELSVEVDGQAHPLVVYTSETSWKLPTELWDALRQNHIDVPISFAVRGLVYDGTSVVSGPSGWTRGTFRIAPAEANGSIVYWTTSHGTRLKGFAIGSETVTEVLRPDQSGVACFGCHSSTPDGRYAALSAAPDPNDGSNDLIALRTVDGAAAEPYFLTPSAKSLLERKSQMFPTFSPAHWQPADRLMVSLYRTLVKWELIWTDLETSTTEEGLGWGKIALDGDPNASIALPTFSHDGTRVAYVSSASGPAAFNVVGGDLRAVPFVNRLAGVSTPVPGASDPSFTEYYPTYSADDQWLAFNRVPGSSSSYNNSQAEVYVVASAGGTPHRLAANDPSSCSGLTSPGTTNSWPKWSPVASASGGRTYYWLTFSSVRRAGGLPQLYVAPVVVEANQVTSYPALYLWNQPADEGNHTPAWDIFELH